MKLSLSDWVRSLFLNIMLIEILTNTEYTSNYYNWNLCYPPFIEGYCFSSADGKLKLGWFALHQLSELLLESPDITNSLPLVPNNAQKPLLHSIAFLLSPVIGCLLPSLTLKRNEWGSVLWKKIHGDSH
jgi:hypothetical protein